MELNRKIVTFLLIAIYLIGMVVSSIVLFSLEDRLIYDLNVMDLTDADKADAAFYTVYIIIGLTMVLGLFAIYHAYKNEKANVIYVEKTKEERSEEQLRKDKKEEENSRLTLTNLNSYNKKGLDEKNLNALLNNICKDLEASQGAIYLNSTKDSKRKVVLKASYAMAIAESEVIEFEFGEGLVGQVAKEKRTIYVDDIPEGYIKIVSGLGGSSPSYLLIIPILYDDDLVGVVEISSFISIKQEDISILEKFFKDFGESVVGKKKISDEKPTLVTSEGEADHPKKKSQRKTEDK